jgi:hypothetical protein
MLLEPLIQRTPSFMSRLSASVKLVSMHHASYHLRFINLFIVNELTDLPAQVSETLKTSFTTVPADADLKSYNSEWQQKHSQSPAHLQSAYNVQFLLDNSTKGQCEADLLKLLEAPSATIEDAVRGLELLDEWKSDNDTKDAYRTAAVKKWPEATVFQKK